MGYMRHHGIMITGSDLHEDSLFNKDNYLTISIVHEKAKQIFPEKLVSDLQMSVMNAYKSFAIFPDGSKEGWSDSDEGENRRDAFIKWIQGDTRSRSFIDWVEIQYGDDERMTRICRHSDEVDDEDD